MTWVKLDDGYLRHPKIVRAGRDARDLDVAGMCYAASNLTDGFLPAEALGQIATEAGVRRPAQLAARLVEVGRWEPAEGGFQVHDYLEYNPSREQVLRDRERARSRRQAPRNGRSPERPANVARRSPERPANVGRRSGDVRMAPSPSHDPVPMPAKETAPGEHAQSRMGGAGGDDAARAPVDALVVSEDEAALVAAFKTELGYDEGGGGDGVDWRRELAPALAGQAPLAPAEVRELGAYYDRTRTRGKVPRTVRALVKAIPEYRRDCRSRDRPPQETQGGVGTVRAVPAGWEQTYTTGASGLAADLPSAFDLPNRYRGEGP